jgi:hypothetical protein
MGKTRRTQGVQRASANKLNGNARLGTAKSKLRIPAWNIETTDVFRSDGLERLKVNCEFPPGTSKRLMCSEVTAWNG